MIGILEGLTPVFVVILLGYFARRQSFVPDLFWPHAERITFYVLFPSLLVANAAKADLAGIDIAPMLVAMLAGISVIIALCFPLRPPLRLLVGAVRAALRLRTSPSRRW